jgi:hypothetical protein
MKIFQKLISEKDIDNLLEYHWIDDQRTDNRPDVRSKHPRWNVEHWPQKIVQTVLDQILDYEYLVEEVIFNQSRISFRLHADSGDGDQHKLGHGVIIPLKVSGPSATVFFDNYWPGPSTKFSKILIKDYEYNLHNKHGTLTYIDNIKTLLQQCLHNPMSVTDFIVNSDFIKNLEYLISARENQAISKKDNRCYDYTNIVNYQKEKMFSNSMHQQYLNHIPIESLHGLTVDQIVPWNIGDVMIFDRKQLHCAAAGHQEKIGITVFTQRV